jgi:hypothetical protein
MDKVCKFVALALLLLIAGPSAIAAASIQTGQKSSMHCSDCCPVSGAMQRSVSVAVAAVEGNPCCQISSQPQAPVSPKNLPEQTAPAVAGSNQHVFFVIPDLKTCLNDTGQNDHRRKPRATALLCTFLI